MQIQRTNFSHPSFGTTLSKPIKEAFYEAVDSGKVKSDSKAFENIKNLRGDGHSGEITIRTLPYTKESHLAINIPNSNDNMTPVSRNFTTAELLKLPDIIDELLSSINMTKISEVNKNIDDVKLAKEKTNNIFNVNA